MKKLLSISVLAATVILFMFVSCKKEKDKVLNKITIAGNSTSALNADYIPAAGVYILPHSTNCITTMYASEIIISFTSGAALDVMFYTTTQTTTIPTGTFKLAPECQAGFLADFYTGQTKSAVGCFSSGTITVVKNGGTYDIDINLVINADCGNGTLKGNFMGPMMETTPNK